MRCDGYDGSIDLYDDRLVISRPGARSFKTLELPESKAIPLDGIETVHFKGAGLLHNGHISFDLMHERPRKSAGSSSGASGATGSAGINENKVIFQPKQEAAFVALLGFLQENGVSVTFEDSFSIADEIEQLSVLRQSGILSREEFQRRKRVLLGF